MVIGAERIIGKAENPERHGAREAADGSLCQPFAAARFREADEAPERTSVGIRKQSAGGMRNFGDSTGPKTLWRAL